jgi:hypothetical protein
VIRGQARTAIAIGGLVLCGFVAACAVPAASSTPGVTGRASPSAAPAGTATVVPAARSTPAPLTDDELASITAGGWVPIPADAPQPKVDAIAAEATVRATYGGSRETIGVRRVAIQLVNRIYVGWVVALTPQAGIPCNLHPGLRPRAIEGGIVDDQTGEMFWTMTCG